MDNLMSPSNGEGVALFGQSNEQREQNTGPQDALIRVKIYFYGENKDLRQSTFPKEL